MADARKRYIAGAVCPTCGAVDKACVLGSEGEKSLHCNACDFGERRGEASPGEASPVGFKES